MTAGGGTIQQVCAAASAQIAKPAVDLSVCILNWNRSGLLAGCLHSLRCIRSLNTRKFEIIVVDNGSTDDSVELVRREFSEVQLITIEKNIGIAKAFNEGIRRGSAAYFVLLNNDTVLLDDCLDQMAQFLDENPKAGMVAGRLLNPDGSTQAQYYPRRLPSLSSVALELLWPTSLSRRLGASEMSRQDLEKMSRMEQVPGAFIMVRREVFESVGLFDERYTCWYEDVDFCCRCHRAGWENWYLPQARTVHLGGSTLREVRFSQRTMWRFHGLLLYWGKHCSTFQNALLRLIVLLVVFLRLPILGVLRIWPKAEVRRSWKGALPAYWRLLGSLVGLGQDRIPEVSNAAK